MINMNQQHRKSSGSSFSALNRRQAIQAAMLAPLALSRVLAPSLGAAESAGTPGVVGGAPYALPPLPYAYDALEPYIDAQTMQIHHDKHHAAYVTNLNKAIVAYPDLGRKTPDELLRQLDSIPEQIRTAVRNQGGGHVNHTFFWSILSKTGGLQPKGELHMILERKFMGFSGFQDQFTAAAASLFGSGWAWLTVDAQKQLRIETTPNQDSPLSQGRTPILGLDVWEHAYYLKYQNRRPEYIAAFFKVINWPQVLENYRRALA
jgi:superoxide dismutase, Fe-Mn family